MTPKVSILLSFGIGAVILAAANGEPHLKKVKCLDKEIDLKDICKGRMECTASFLTEDEIKTFKDPKAYMDKKKEIAKKAFDNKCIMVCQLKKHLKLINEDGTLNKADQEKLIDSMFPEAARAGLKTGLAKCHADNSKDFKDDNMCESYKPFEECVKKTFATECKLEPNDFTFDAMWDHHMKKE